MAAATAAAIEARAAREAEARKKAIKAFFNLVLDLLRWGVHQLERDWVGEGACRAAKSSLLECGCSLQHACASPTAGMLSICASLRSRRQLWTLVPWDPTAPFILARKHQQVYQELQVRPLGWLPGLVALPCPASVQGGLAGCGAAFGVASRQTPPAIWPACFALDIAQLAPCTSLAGPGLRAPAVHRRPGGAALAAAPGAHAAAGAGDGGVLLHPGCRAWQQ